MKNRVSIITVVYNGKDEIERTLESVKSQTFQDKEYIIIDGGSTDGTLDIVGKYKSHVDVLVSERDKGIYDAMNKGALLAHGEWIVYMNAGDAFASENVLQEIFSSGHDYSDVDVIYGDMLSCYTAAPLVIKPKPLSMLKYRMIFCHQSSYIRADLMRKYPFDLRYRYVADFDLFHKLYLAGKKFYYLPIIMTNYYPDGGFTNKHILSVMREENKISGIKDLKWLRHLVYTYFSYCLNSLLPTPYLNKLRLMLKG